MTTETTIEWADPPPPRTTNGSWARVADALRANPGRWALIDKANKSASGVRTLILSGRGSFAPKGAYETTQRTNGDGTYDTYARYVGGDQ